MSQSIRRLNQKGIDLFRNVLDDLRRDGRLAIPRHILIAPEYSEEIPGAMDIEAVHFSTKRDAAEYLQGKLPSIKNEGLLGDPGLWTWLALFFFDSICPLEKGTRHPKADPHYILDVENSLRTYRHLLMTPYRISQEVPDHNRIFLDTNITIHGEMIEQSMGRLYILRVPAVREVVDRLYYDEERGGPKRGIFPTKKAKPGDYRNRLSIRIKQLRRTYDVAGLTADQLLDLLGNEFKGWLTKKAG